MASLGTFGNQVVRIVGSFAGLVPTRGPVVGFVVTVNQRRKSRRKPVLDLFCIARATSVKRRFSIGNELITQ